MPLFFLTVNALFFYDDISGQCLIPFRKKLSLDLGVKWDIGLILRDHSKGTLH